MRAFKNKLLEFCFFAFGNLFVGEVVAKENDVAIRLLSGCCATGNAFVVFVEKKDFARDRLLV